MKTRIIRNYCAFSGTWWTVQVKFLFWWITAPIAFTEKSRAVFWARGGDKDDLFESTITTIEK